MKKSVTANKANTFLIVCLLWNVLWVVLIFAFEGLRENGVWRAPFSSDELLQMWFIPFFVGCALAFIYMKRLGHRLRAMPTLPCPSCMYPLSQAQNTGTLRCTECGETWDEHRARDVWRAWWKKHIGEGKLALSAPPAWLSQPGSPTTPDA